MKTQKHNLTRTIIWSLMLAGLLLAGTKQLAAFCGFYVAKAGAELFNNKSEVIIVRDGNRTSVTMSNDFKGNVKEFAMVIPVPVVLKKDEIRIADRTVFQKLDAYSAPRLVEYYDYNPCNPPMMLEKAEDDKIQAVSVSKASRKAKDYKVKIEAEYNIGEYNILILSAQESDGLERWLKDNGYAIPARAQEVLEPYVKSNMKFFVVKVNLKEKEKLGFEYLRPIQMSFNSPKFMLPLRLGMANAQGDQDMIVYAFARHGRIEPVNYRTVKVPTDRNIPLYVKEKFGDFYRDLFMKSYNAEGRNSTFLEYAWNITPNYGGVKCDPCVGPPPVYADLKEAGVFWVDEKSADQSVFFTRLHVRYSREKFPQDLAFQITPNRENFQGRYILTYAAAGPFDCPEGQDYVEQVLNRRKRETDELTALTGWEGREDYLLEYTKYIKDEKKKNEIIPTLMIDHRQGPPGDGTTPALPEETGRERGRIVLLFFIGGVFLILLAGRVLKSRVRDL